MSKPKLIKSSSAKAMHELAVAYEFPEQEFKSILKHIECRAACGSYWCWVPYNGSFEWAHQLKEKLEAEGFKAIIYDPDPERNEDDIDYSVKATW